jgi:hypothetical protein
MVNVCSDDISHVHNHYKLLRYKGIWVLTSSTDSGCKVGTGVGCAVSLNYFQDLGVAIGACSILV